MILQSSWSCFCDIAPCFCDIAVLIAMFVLYQKLSSPCFFIAMFRDGKLCALMSCDAVFDTPPPKESGKNVAMKERNVTRRCQLISVLLQDMAMQNVNLTKTCQGQPCAALRAPEHALLRSATARPGLWATT